MKVAVNSRKINNYLLADLYSKYKSKSKNDVDMSKYKCIFYTLIISFSSFIFGFSLKTYKLEEAFSKEISTDSFCDNFEFLFSFSSTMILLGAGISNLSITFIKNIETSTLMSISCVLNLIGYLIIIFNPHIFLLVISKFIIGIGSGISFTFIPQYLFYLSSKKYKSLASSFHPVFITLGLVLGEALGGVEDKLDYRKVHILISCVLFLDSFVLYFLPILPIENLEDHTTILDLLSEKDIRFTTYATILFHVGQHFTGVNYISIFTCKIFSQSPYSYAISLISLSSSAFLTILSSIMMNYLGEGVMMLLSCITVGISTTCLAFINKPEIFIFIYLIGFNFGLSFIPWGYATRKFELRNQNAANSLGISCNMIIGFIAANISIKLHYYLQNYAYLIYTFSMIIMSIFSIYIFQHEIKKKLCI